MDNYITYEFLKKLGKASKNEKQELRRKKAIEIFESEKGKIIPSKIAEILGISESQVIRYLGKTRLEKYGYKNFNASVKSKRSSETSRTVRDSGQKLTLTRVSKLVSDRNRRIKALYDSGLPIEEVAEEEHISLEQAKEIYMALGLSIYSLSELRKIQDDIDEKDKAIRQEKSRKRRNRKRREKRAEQRRKKQQEEKNSERKRQFEETTGIAIINNFNELLVEMKKLLQQGKSRLAIELGESFLYDETILTPEERKKLAVLLNELKSVKRAYQKMEARREEELQGLEETFEK